MFLDEDAVRRLLRMEDLIPAVERALASLSAGEVVQPVRLMLPVADRAPRHAGRASHHRDAHRGGVGRRDGAVTVVVATSSRTPVLQGEWLSPGTHVNAVGACRPDWRELDDAAVARARLYVESREAATRESGDVIAARDVVAEIGEVIAGTSPGLRTAEEVTLFKSVGVAVGDVVAADLVYRAALRSSQPGADRDPATGGAPASPNSHQDG